VLQVAGADGRRGDPEHALDDRLVVERDQRDGQVFVQGAQVDGQVGGHRGLADASLVGDDGDHLGAGMGGIRGHGSDLSHPD
jgi:hypothetical protein